MFRRIVYNKSRLYSSATTNEKKNNKNSDGGDDEASLRRIRTCRVKEKYIFLLKKKPYKEKTIDFLNRRKKIIGKSTFEKGQKNFNRVMAEATTT